VYEWDEVGRLTKAWRWDLSDPGTATDDVPTGTAAVRLRYAYDGGGNRVLKTAIDDADHELHTVYALGSLELRRAAFDSGDYVDDRTTEVAYLAAHSASLARLHYSDDSLPTLSSGHLHVLFELPDHLGSSSIVIDKETSELVERSTYLAKGGADSDYRPERWDSFREDHRFTGKEEDIEVGLTYFGARYYAPGLGRFASADPLTIHGLGSDPNVYAYVEGRLLSGIDPLGLALPDGGVENDTSNDLKDAEAPAPDTTQQDQQNDIAVAASASNFTVAEVRIVADPKGWRAKQDLRFEAAQKQLANDGISVLEGAIATNPAFGPHGLELTFPRFEIPTVDDHLQQLRLNDNTDAADGMFIAGSAGLTLGSSGIIEAVPGAIQKLPYLSGAGSLGFGELTNFSDAWALGAANDTGATATELGATELNSAAGRIAAKQRTAAILETREGTTLAGGGAADLTPAQREMARARGMTPVAMADEDAEITVIQQAGQRGLKPLRGATSRDICSGCKAHIEQLGGHVTGKRTFEFPENL
jgi:RHS repeat-associated protein